MKTLKISTLLIVGFIISLNSLFCQETNSKVEIITKRTNLDELELTIKNATINSIMDGGIQLNKNIFLEELKIVETGEDQYYLMGYSSERTKRYALDVKKLGNNFIHTRIEETHSCELKEMDKEIFILKENGQIAGCFQGNHTIAVGEK